MPASAVDVVKPAFEHMVQQAFKPFRLGQWARLAAVGLLSGELSGGGCSYQVPFNPRGNGSDRFLEQATLLRSMPVVLGIALLVVLGIALFIALIYVSSMMRFVLFDSVVAKECHIRMFWARRRGPGSRYFVFQLLFTLTVGAGFALLAGVGAFFAFGFGWIRNPGQHLLPLILLGVVLVLLFFLLLISAVVVMVLSKDFVVPQMALEDVSVSEGWRRLLSMMQAEKLGYAGYIGLKFVLSIASAFVMAIAALVSVLVMLIPIAIVGAIGFFGGRFIGLGWNPYTMAIAIVAGCIALLAIIIVVLLLSVPTIVFFPAYAIHFLAMRYPPLSAMLYPPPTAPGTAGIT